MKFCKLILIGFCLATAAVAADKSVDDGAGGPSAQEYKNTERASKEFQRTGNKAGFKKAGKEEKLRKLREAASNAVPDGTPGDGPRSR